MKSKLIPKEKNVGNDHNDLQSRIVSTLGMLILFIFSLPQVGINDAYHRILLLEIALVGTGALAWGMVFGRKNIMAGIVAQVVPLFIYLMPEFLHRTLAMILAPIAAIHLLISIFSRKCIFNSIFSINSYKQSEN